MPLKTHRKQYSMGFAACSLRLNESIQVSKIFLELKDWSLVKQEVNIRNVLQARTPGTLKRLYQEISSRLRLLKEDEMKLLVYGTTQDQICLVWLAICRRYRFIAEFAKEVIQAKFLRLDTKLEISDFENFFEEKSQLYEELESISDITKKRARQIIFQMMREAKILSDANMLQGIILSEQFLKAIRVDKKNTSLYFPHII